MKSLLIVALLTLTCHAQVASQVDRRTGKPTTVSTPQSPTNSSSPSKTPAYLLFAALQASTIYDMETTFRTLDRCPTCREGNPIMRPFVSAGRPATYAFTTGINLLALHTSLQLRKAHKKWWYVPSAVAIGIHVFAGIHNSRIK